jgi:hypothetical protein
VSTFVIVFHIEVPQTDVVPGPPETYKASRASAVDFLMDPSLEHEFDGFCFVSTTRTPNMALLFTTQQEWVSKPNYVRYVGYKYGYLVRYMHGVRSAARLDYLPGRRHPASLRSLDLAGLAY